MQNDRGRITNRATRLCASTLGVLVGLAGVEHGILEVLQGDVAPQGMMINAIGPQQKLWEFASERALTVVPSLLVSGILSFIIGVVLVVWAYAFVDGKRGAIVLLFLSVALFLVGGGFAPIFLAILAFLAATRVHKPLTLWRSHVPTSLASLMARLWPWMLFVSVASFVVAVEIAIFGQPLSGLVGAETASSIQLSLGLAALITAIIALPAANASDAKRS